MAVLRFEDTFDAVYGLDIVEVEPGRVRARVPVTNAVKQALGLVHGGVYAAAAESISTMGTYLAVHEDGNVAMGLSNATSFLRPITAGTIHIEARARHSGAPPPPSPPPAPATPAGPRGCGTSTSPTTTAASARRRA